MYTMLTGRPPFTGKSVTEVIESLKRDRPVPLDLINPELPEALVELVHQLLEKDPADRPPTALAVMNRLKAMRAGLQREQTVVHDGSPTEVGPITSGTHDTSADRIDVPESGSPTAASDAPTDVKRKPKKTIVSKGASAVPSVNPNQLTVVSSGSEKTLRPDGSVAEGDRDSERLNTSTHFQTVSDTDARSSIFRDTSSAQNSALTQWLSIAGMVGVLMIGCGLFIYASRPPTADQLYEAALNGDAGARKAFMIHCPDDKRFDEILNLDMASELSSTLKRLSVKLTPLEGYEQGFVNAMEGRDQDPDRSIESIQQWLNVYDSPISDSDLQLKELIKLAKHEQSQLLFRTPSIIVHPDAQKLIDEIHARVESGESEATRVYLIGIIETHGKDFGKDMWAKPAVDEARKQLDLLDEFGPPSVETDDTAAEVDSKDAA
jgi:serine/threonine-protein kinase